MRTCGALAREPFTHLSVLAIIPSDSCHCPDLGRCGLRGFEVIDESYPFIHYWRWRSKPWHPGYRRNNPADQTEVKRRGSRRRMWERGKVIWAKKCRWEVRGEGGETHRKQKGRHPKQQHGLFLFLSSKQSVTTGPQRLHFPSTAISYRRRLKFGMECLCVRGMSISWPHGSCQLAKRGFVKRNVLSQKGASFFLNGFTVLHKIFWKILAVNQKTADSLLMPTG